jgi:hypothetical protein
VEHISGFPEVVVEFVRLKGFEGLSESACVLLLQKKIRRTGTIERSGFIEPHSPTLVDQPSEWGMLSRWDCAASASDFDANIKAVTPSHFHAREKHNARPWAPARKEAAPKDGPDKEKEPD